MLQFHGEYGPGGGFQAGAIIDPLVVILYALARSVKLQHWLQLPRSSIISMVVWWLHFCMAASGVGLYVVGRLFFLNGLPCWLADL